MRIRLAEMNTGPVLAGAVNGRALLTRLLDATADEPREPEPLLLDFGDIDVATASFLRESLLTFRDVVRHRRSNFYPVVANAPKAVLEELAEVLEPRGDVMMTCKIHGDDSVADAELIGQLDPKQKLTFELVREHGETDARELMRDYGEREQLKHPTAWNNRLASLAGLGLIVELSEGRSKRYRRLFGEQ